MPTFLNGPHKVPACGGLECQAGQGVSEAAKAPMPAAAFSLGGRIYSFRIVTAIAREPGPMWQATLRDNGSMWLSAPEKEASASF